MNVNSEDLCQFGIVCDIFALRKQVQVREVAGNLPPSYRIEDLQDVQYPTDQSKLKIFLLNRNF